MTRRGVIRVILGLLTIAGAAVVWWGAEHIWGVGDVQGTADVIQYFGSPAPETPETMALRSALFSLIFPAAATLTTASVVGFALTIVIPRWRGETLPLR